jgi:hypothetical protein
MVFGIFQALPALSAKLWRTFVCPEIRALKRQQKFR